MTLRDTDEFERYIEQARAEWKNVGLAVAVVIGRNVVYARGFGLRQLGDPAIVDADTLFQVGSTTKAFTAAALGILADEGKVDWDDRVISHLPKFKLEDPALTQDVTIRDTLAHRSGVGDNNYSPFLTVMTADEALTQLQYIAAEAPFRDSYRYNNLMYAAAGRVVEVVSGTSWHNFIKRRLLKPLNMNRSETSPYDLWNAEHVAPVIFGSAPAGFARMRDAKKDNIAMPHGWGNRAVGTVLPWQSYDNAAAAGALVSSVADMANWLILNLNNGRFGDLQVLKDGTLRELHSTQNMHVDEHHFPFEEAKETYALGLRRTVYRNTTYLAHGGGMIGFPAYIALLPERKMGVVVLSNGSQAAREKLGFYKFALHNVIALGIVDRLLGCKPRDWSKEFMDRARAMERQSEQQEEKLQRSRIQLLPTSLPLHQYAGEYADLLRSSGRVTISMEDDALRLTFAGKGAYSASLEHWQADVFRLRSSPGIAELLGPQFATFATDALGKIASMSAFGTTFQHLPRK